MTVVTGASPEIKGLLEALGIAEYDVVAFNLECAVDSIMTLTVKIYVRDEQTNQLTSSLKTLRFEAVTDE